MWNHKDVRRQVFIKLCRVFFIIIILCQIKKWGKEKLNWVIVFQQNSSRKLFFFPSPPHTNSIINPISFLPMPNVKLCLSYSWLRAESVGFGQKNVNWGMLGYGWPSCVSACRFIKEISHPPTSDLTQGHSGQILYTNVDRSHLHVVSHTCLADYREKTGSFPPQWKLSVWNYSAGMSADKSNI